MVKKYNNMSNSINNANNSGYYTNPQNQFTRYAYNDPQFALGNLIGSYLGQKYLGNLLGGENNDLTGENNKNTWDSLNNNNERFYVNNDGSVSYNSPTDTGNGNKFTLDGNGNAVYSSQANGNPITGVTTSAPIVGSTFKDYLMQNDNNGNTGLLANQNVTQYAAPTTGAGTSFSADAGNYIKPVDGGNIPAIDGSLGTPINGNLNMSLNGSYPFSQWNYKNPYYPKNRGDVATQAATSPINEEQTPAMYSVDNNFPGMVKSGNIDLANSPTVKNEDGSVSTVRSIGVNIDGKEYLLPTVSDDGRIPPTQESGTQQPIQQSSTQPIRPTDTQPIKPETNHIQPVDAQPIKAEQPITDDKKEVTNGNSLRLMSASDGKMYDFNVSDDGKWIRYGKNARLPISQKDNLINAMHNPQQSYADIENMGTSLHVGNRGEDTSQPIHNGPAPTIPQEFDAKQWEQEFITRQLKRGLSFDAINSMLQTLRPQVQQREANYNEYQANSLMPTYWAAVRGENQPQFISQNGKMVQNPNYVPAGTSQQIAQAISKYNPTVGNYMLSTSPTSINYYNEAVGNRKAAQQQRYTQSNMKYRTKLSDYENDRQWQRSIKSKQEDARLKVIASRMNMNDKLAYNKASAEQKAAMIKQYGGTDADVRVALGGGRASAPRSSSGSSSSGGGNGGSGKISESDNKVVNNMNNLYAAAITPGDDGKPDHDAVAALQEYVDKHANDYDDEDRTYMLSKAYAAQFLMNKAEGNENVAAEYAQQIPDYYRSELLPQYF